MVIREIKRIDLRGGEKRRERGRTSPVECANFENPGRFPASADRAEQDVMFRLHRTCKLWMRRQHVLDGGNALRARKPPLGENPVLLFGRGYFAVTQSMP
jgi:hypothetical protein